MPPEFDFNLWIAPVPHDWTDEYLRFNSPPARILDSFRFDTTAINAARKITIAICEKMWRRLTLLESHEKIDARIWLVYVKGPNGTVWYTQLEYEPMPFYF